MQVVKLYFPNSVRTRTGKFAPRTEEHEFKVFRHTGPRGGFLGYMISLPNGGVGFFNQSRGESPRSQKKRQAEFEGWVRKYKEDGWIEDKNEADRLAQAHARARAKTSGQESSPAY